MRAGWGSENSGRPVELEVISVSKRGKFGLSDTGVARPLASVSQSGIASRGMATNWSWCRHSLKVNARCALD